MRERSTWRLLGAAATSFLSSRVLAFLAGLAVAIPILLGGSEALASRMPAAAIEAGRPSPSPSAGASQLTPWGLPGPPPGTTTPTLFANFANTPQSKFLEGGAFDQSGNFWFVAIDSGWISYLAPDGSLHPVVNCNPPASVGQDCEPQGTRWHDGKLYLTTRHRGILVYDPSTHNLSTLVYTYRNQLFKGPNDLDFDAEGNLFFTDPWGTGPGPNQTDRTGDVYQYSNQGVLHQIADSLQFPNGIAVSPDDSTLAVSDYAAGRIWYMPFLNGPGTSCQECAKDPTHQTFGLVKAGTYLPGNAGADGMHYDVKGDLWFQANGVGGIMEADPHGVILGFVPIPNGDHCNTNFAFGGPGNQDIYMEGACTGTVYRFKAPYPGLIGPGGTRLPAQ